MPDDQMILPQTMMRELLANSCSNPYYPTDFDYPKAEKEMFEFNETRAAGVQAKGYPDPPDGWHTYTVELHCLRYEIMARQVWNKRTKKHTWQIKSFTRSPS